jgi:NADPH:quinone reductase-like Zn-dependent oxidoreductase
VTPAVPLYTFSTVTARLTSSARLCHHPAVRAAVVPRHGDPDVIEIRDDWPDPGAPDAHEVKVAVEAAGLNPSDWKIRARGGGVGGGPTLPYVAGREAVGTVAAVGNGVTEFEVGDPVWAYFGWHARPGGHCEQLLVAASAVALRPLSVTVEEAAGVPLAGITAWQALRMLEVPAGGAVVVTSGSGGVGHYAVQIAVALGFDVVATAGPTNQDFVRSLGASRVVDYHDERATLDAVKGATHLLDATGPATIAAYQGVMASGGRVVAVAGLPRDIRPDITARAMHADPVGADMGELTTLMDARKLHTTLHEVFPLEGLAEAHAVLAGGHVRGKIVIKVS